jgi:hypothetical protein
MLGIVLPYGQVLEEAPIKAQLSDLPAPCLVSQSVVAPWSHRLLLVSHRVKAPPFLSEVAARYLTIP